MLVHETFEVHMDWDEGLPVSVNVYRVGSDGDRQFELVGAQQFGPFDTHVDVARWVWRQVALAMDRLMA